MSRLIIPPVEDIKERDPYLYDTLKRIIGAINGVTGQLGILAKPAPTTSTAKAAAPDAPTKLEVTGSAGIFSVKITDHPDNSRPINFFLESSPNSDFSGAPTVFPLGDTLRSDLNLGNVTLFWRVRAKYLSSDFSPYTVQLTAVTGGTPGGGGVSAADVRRLTWWIARNSVVGGGPVNNRGIVRDSLGRYVCVTEGNDCIRSTDGITWSRVRVVPAANNSQFRWVDVRGSRIGTCDIAGRFYKSDDGGATWTIVGDATPFHAHGASMIHYSGSGDIWVAAPNAGSRIYRSTSNMAAITDDVAVPVVTNDIAFDGTNYVIVGNGGEIHTNPNFSGEGWTSRTSGTVNPIQRIIFSPSLSRLVAVRGDDWLRYSDDSGVTWTEAEIKPSGTWNALGLIWTGSEFWLCIGSNDSEKQLAHSKDGKYWNWLPFPGGGSLNGIWFNDGDIALACGQSDFIATLGI